MKEILLNLLALVLTALTPGGGEIPPELQAEIDSLKEAINAMTEGAPAEGAEPPTDNAEVTNAIMQRLTDLASKVKNSADQSLVVNKITESRLVAVNSAMKAFNKAQDGLGHGRGKVLNHNFDAMVKNQGLRVFNANNANFVKGIDEEFSFEQKLRQEGFLIGLNVKTMEPGTNVIRWNEGSRGSNATAIIAIGAARPAKANTTAPSVETTDTLGQQTTVSLQLLKAINGVKEIYNDDIKKDIEDKIALQVAECLKAANNPINITETVNEGNPTIQDVILYAYMQLKLYAGGKTVVIAVPSQKFIAMNLLKDKNGNKLAPISFPDLEVVSFITGDTYTTDDIFGWVSETSTRFYNDGLSIYSDELNGIGVSGDNFSKSQITLAAQYLNEAMVIRGTDIVTTIYDSISGCILELTAGA